MYFGRIFGYKINEKNIENLRGVLVEFLIDFERYFTASPKVATLDPFENFRVNRGVRHFPKVLNSIKKALEH